jgi:hypothetical protein
MGMCSNCGGRGQFEGMSRAELVVIEARLFGGSLSHYECEYHIRDRTKTMMGFSKYREVYE